MFVEFDRELYTPRDGICVGACVASVLSDIYLPKLDTALVVFFPG